MKPFTESMRYEYPLNPSSLVLDVGGFEGRFANEIHRLYGCRVWCFEPVFHREIRSKLHPLITLFPYGIGGKSGEVSIGVKGDSTGMWATGVDSVTAEIMDVNEVITVPVDLMKLNCEGAEYEILEALLDGGKATMVKNIQVQFHRVVENYVERWESIRSRLLATHELTYDAPFCWENYQLK
jgi:FkbM family methyltransferase